MKVDSLKQRLQELVGEVNATNTVCLKFHQQKKTEGNMSFIGGNGRLYVQPSSLGYDISLSGKSLEKEMYPFMRELCGSECTGYKQPNRSIGKKNQPFWRVESFELVKEAVYRYAHRCSNAANVEMYKCGNVKNYKCKKLQTHKCNSS